MQRVRNPEIESMHAHRRSRAAGSEWAVQERGAHYWLDWMASGGSLASRVKELPVVSDLKP